MKNLTIVALSLLLVSSVLFMAFRPSPASNVANDHITLVPDRNNSKVFVSKNGTDYEVVEFDKKKINGDHDLNSTISLVRKYEKEGYRIVSVNGGNVTGGVAHKVVWMTREK